MAWAWRESPASQESVAFYQMGGSALALWSRAMLAADAGAADDGAGFDGVVLSHNVASRAAVDAALADAERAGGAIVRQAHEQPWGGYSGYFADPEGHRWEVAWNPFFTLNPDGTITLP